MTSSVLPLAGQQRASLARGTAVFAVQTAAQVALRIVFIADSACMMTDAIVRTLARLLVTRRRMLEWVTAAQARAGLDLTFGGFYRRMAGGVLFALAAFVACARLFVAPL